MRNQRSTTGLVIAGILALLAIIALFLWSGEEPVPPATTTQATPTPEPAPTVMPAQTAVATGGPTTPQADRRPATPQSLRTDYSVLIRAWDIEGQPVPGAEVTLLSMGDSSPSRGDEIPVVILDEKGEGRGTLTVSGLHRAVARASALSGQELFRVGPVAPVVSLDLIMIPATEASGRTVDSQGAALAGVRVTSFTRRGEIDTTTSTEDGTFHFEGPQPEGAVFRGDAPGFAPSFSEPLVPGREVKIIMTRGASLVVRATTVKAGLPMEGLSLTLKPERESHLDKPSGTTDKSGTLVLENLAPAKFTLRSGDPTWTLSPPELEIVLSEGERREVEVQVDGAGIIKGIVMDGDTGKGIPNANVYARFEDNPRFDTGLRSTANDGSFRLDGLPAGTYWVQISGLPPQYGSRNLHEVMAQKDVRLAPGQTVEDQQFEFFATDPVIGRVVLQDGTAVSGATVRAFAPVLDGPEDAVSWHTQTMSDEKGEFRVYNLPAEAVAFEASWRGRRSDRLGPFAPDSPELDEIVLTLADVETGTVSGKVVDESGYTLRAHVKLTGQEAGGRVMERRSLSTETDGRFLFSDVVPGTFELSYGERTTGLVGYTNSDGPYTLAPGQHLGDILLQLDRSGLAITGVLRNAAGDPVPDFMLDLLNFNEETGFEHFVVTATDQNGNFVFENLEEGRYRIEPQHHDAGSWRMSVEAGETVEITLPDPEEFPESGTLNLEKRVSN